MQTKLDAINSVPPSLIFQAGKLVDIPQLVDELAAAKELLQSNQPIGRIYGISGGSLTAAAFALAFSARLNPQSWSWAADMLDDLSSYLTGSPGWKKRRYNFNPRFGLYNLKPLRRWLERNINGHSSEKPLMISELPVDLYIGAADRDGLLTLFGKPDNSLQLQYHFLTIHPPQDAPLVDALIAAVSTLLTTEPALVNGVLPRLPADFGGYWRPDLRPGRPRPAQDFTQQAVYFKAKIAKQRPYLFFHHACPSSTKRSPAIAVVPGSKRTSQAAGDSIEEPHCFDKHTFTAQCFPRAAALHRQHRSRYQHAPVG